MTSPPSAERSAPGGSVPKVSVVMTVYNAGAFLALAIESVLAQSFRDFEFLIHDDGSTDGSLAVLHDYAARDPRVVVSSGPNQGLPAVLNQLIAQARGAFLARMDADDICLPERFERQVAHLDAHPEIVVLGSACLFIDGAGRSIKPTAPPCDHATIDDMHCRGLCAIEHPSVMMRREPVLALGGYDESFRSAQDLELWLRVGEVGCLANLPDVLLKYRLHDGSISGSKAEQQRDNCRRACQKAWARRGLTEAEAGFAYQPWRMEDTRASRLKFYQSYAWQAWKNGYRDTWRHYALQVLKLAPLSASSWKLFVLGALRRPDPHG